MKRIWLGVAAAATLSACSGGNPFAPAPGGGTPTTPTTPSAVAGRVESVAYNAGTQTLVVSGVDLDGSPYAASYTRKAALDTQGYQAYTSQDSSLGRHTTAYVKELNNTRATIVVSGGQFGHYFGGSAFSRDGTYSPNAGNVTYAGNYVGLLNASGDGGDLLPVAPGTPAAVQPRQAAEVAGRIVLRADFANNTVDGIVYDRVSVDAATALENLELAPGTITATGGIQRRSATGQRSVHPWQLCRHIRRHRSHGGGRHAVCRRTPDRHHRTG